MSQDGTSSSESSSVPTHSLGRDLGEGLSIKALLLQAKTLIESLAAFTPTDYPVQTLTIAEILRLLADRTQAELLRLEVVKPLSGSDQARARDLGNIVHVLHSYLRYLQASDALRTPPGIQHAISLLISTHGTEALSCSDQEINVLVRPQWRYNLKYIDIIHQFENDAECDLAFALDPDGTLQASDAKTLVEKLWDAAYESGDRKTTSSDRKLDRKLPKHVAVLSFAGLDRDDVLLYPLLAHELGHFLDFSSDDLENLSTDSQAEPYLPTIKDVIDIGLPADQHLSIVETIKICLREITADLLASRMAGLGYLFAFNEFFKTLGPWPGPVVNPESGYPGFRLRLRLIFDELDSTEGGIESVTALTTLLEREDVAGKTILQDYIHTLRKRVEPISIAANPKKATRNLSDLLEKAVRAAIPAIQDLVRQIIPNERAAKLPPDLTSMIGLINDRIPPFQPPRRSQRESRHFDPWLFHEILTAGWLYQLAIGEERVRAFPADERLREYQDTCLILLKAIELEGARDAIKSLVREDRRTEHVSKPEGERGNNNGHGVISGPSLRAALDRENSAERLVICPDFGDAPIEAASRDLHLGHWFRISKRTSLQHIDIAFSSERDKARREGQNELFVRSGGEFVLQPGDFALAVSLEYVYLPSDMMAFVEGKSSLGRAGLMIATATQVAPGFKGCIVLELFNAGTVPLILRPAMRIAQLVLVSTDTKLPGNWLYSGRFKVQIKP